MGQGFISKYILRDIAGFIRKRKGTTDEIKPVDMAAELESIPTFEDGKQAEHDRFWDTYQANGTRKDYNSGFRSKLWVDEIYQPKYDITATSGAAACFATSSITDTKVPITTTSMNQIFQNATQLKIVRMITLYNFDGNFTNAFQNCSALESITFGSEIANGGMNLQWSKNLSHDSIVNIVGCLSTTTSGLSVTLSKTAVNAAFTTEEWTALEQTRPNWTISLV